MKPLTARNALLLLGLAALVAAACLLSESDPRILCALPALALPLLLALERYPGERILLVLGTMRRPRRERLRASAPAGVRRDERFPRGSELLARALAVRPPPATPAAA